MFSIKHQVSALAAERDHLVHRQAKFGFGQQATLPFHKPQGLSGPVGPLQELPSESSDASREWAEQRSPSRAPGKHRVGDVHPGRYEPPLCPTCLAFTCSTKVSGMTNTYDGGPAYRRNSSGWLASLPPAFCNSLTAAITLGHKQRKLYQSLHHATDTAACSNHRRLRVARKIRKGKVRLATGSANTKDLGHP